VETTGRIEVTDEAGTAVVALFGEHDVSTAETFAARIEGLVDSGSPVVVDLTQARFVDSTIIGTLIEGHMRLTEHGRAHALAAVVTPHTAPQRTWKLLALHDRVPTFSTRDEAVAAVSRND
jgi:anti-anti-sigma factor